MTLWTLARRNATRDRLRTALTLIGVAVAVLAFVALRAVPAAFRVGADYAAKDRLTTRHKISYDLPLPKRYVEEIATHIRGVKAVSHCDWFGGRWAKAPNEFFANLACAVDAFEVYPEMKVERRVLDAFARDKQAAIVGDVLAAKLGLHAGDRMTLQGSFYPGDWELRIAGTYTAPPLSAVDRSSLFFRWDYKNERVPERYRDTVGWVFTRVDDPSRSAEVSRAIDAYFDEREIRTATMSERNANAALLGGVNAVLSALDIASILVLAIMTLILANTIAMGVGERSSEYGALLALGFSPRRLRRLIAAEAIGLSLAGGLIGLGLAWPLVQTGLGGWLEVNLGQFFPAFRIGGVTACAAVGLSVALGALAAWLPARRVGRLSVTDAIRRVA